MQEDKKFIEKTVDEIKARLRMKGYNLTTFLEDYNHTLDKPLSLANFSKRLNSGNLKYWEIKQIAEFLGYKIEWKDNHAQSFFEK